MRHSGNALYTVAAIRQIERAAIASLPPGSLMQKAGKAAAELALSLLPVPHSTRKVLILAGPGNNGGDAFVVATLLCRSGVAVTLLFDAEAEKLPADAKEAYARAKQQAMRWESMPGLATLLQEGFDLVVDGLFGIGLSKDIGSPYREAVEALNQSACPVLALDVPSGLDADTGALTGNRVAIRAAHTITFIGDKPGLHTAHGRDMAGIVHVADLDIDLDHFEVPRMFKSGPCLFGHALARRLHNSHKGSYGNVAILGGARGMHGAAVLAGRSALHLGAGRVYAGFLDDAPAYDSVQPELMCRAADNLEFSQAVVIAGPGMGTSARALHFLTEACATPGALVLDADALNLLASDTALQQTLAQRSGNTVLTPHPLEAARLLSISAADIQANRLRAAEKLARQFNAIIVLKGSGTVIAHPDGRIAINTTGNPALATAGTGDVLAGMCGALLAQNYPGWEAGLTAVWIHGLAADRLVENGCGPVGLAAGELIPEARRILNELIQDGFASGQASQAP